MRAGILLIALLAVGCNRERSFDERYATADKTVREKAVEIDAELAERERQASEAAATAPSATPSRGDQATSSMNAAK